MIALRRMLAAALLLGTGVLGACAYDPYTGAYVPCCGYYGYPYYGYPYYRPPPPYYYGPQSAPYYAPPPANLPSAYPNAPSSQSGTTSYPHAGMGSPAQGLASERA